MKKLGYIFISLLLSSCVKNLSGTTGSQGNKLPATGLAASPLLANDPFAPYLDSVPTVLTTISSTNSGSGVTAITTRRFTFSSKNGVNTVYAIMAYPQAAGVYPAILFNHGGGGNAETQLGNVNGYAAMGYVTLAIDQPGIAGTGNTPNSSGPWKSAAPGEGPRLNVTGGPQNSTLFDAGVAGLQAFNYLAKQSNVNAGRMGISGTSWGGYMTTMLSGMLGSRVKAAYSIFGCGYYDAGSFWSSMIAALSPADQVTWETYLDAGRRAPGMTAPYFIEEPSNDTYFWPEAVTATLNAIPGTKDHVIMPNLNHMELTAAGTMKQLYMAYYLKGTGSPFSSINITGTTKQADGSLLITMNASLPASISVSSVQLYYSVPTANWQTRNWQSLPAVAISGTTYQAMIPASLVDSNVNYYGYLVDSRTVTTSTAMGNLNHMPANGMYRIVSRSSGLVLDVTGKITANGTLVQQWPYDSGSNQQWMVTSLGGGQYKIIGVQSGRALDVAGASTADSAAIDIFDYKASTNQIWVITPATGSYYTIASVKSGKLLDVTGNSTAQGTRIQQWHATGGSNQQWAFQAP